MNALGGLGVAVEAENNQFLSIFRFPAKFEKNRKRENHSGKYFVQHFMRVTADRIADANKIDHVKPKITFFKFGNICLRAAGCFAMKLPHRILMIGLGASLLAGCSGNDACNVSGEWIQAQLTYANDPKDLDLSYPQARMNDPTGLLFIDNIISFESSGSIIGGKQDGLPLFGNVGNWKATQWKCEDQERVVVSASNGNSQNGLSERIKIIESDVFHAKAYGPPHIYVRYDGSKEAAGKNFVKSMEAVAAKSQQ